MSWIWTNPSPERLKVESPSKWHSYEGFNLDHCLWVMPLRLPWAAVPFLYLSHSQIEEPEAVNMATNARGTPTVSYIHVNRSSLQIKWFRKITDAFRRIYGICLKFMNKTWGNVSCQHVSGWTLKHFITILIRLGLFRHFETFRNIRTWIKSHRYWRML